jgi:hypothetical protein
MLCQDARIFDAMIMAGTPCPYKGKIGAEALQAWKDNPGKVPEGSNILHEESSESVTNINNYEFAPDDGIEIPWQDD